MTTFRKHLEFTAKVVNGRWDRHLVKLPSRIAAWKAESNWVMKVGAQAAWLGEALLVRGTEATVFCEMLQNPLVRAARELVPNEDGEVSVTCAANLLEVINACQMLRVTVTSDTLEHAIAWLPQMRTSVFEEGFGYLHADRGFAALALGDERTWRFCAGKDRTAPFSAGETFGPDIQGLTAYLAAAIASKASLSHVTPAWRAFLEEFPARSEYRDLAWNGSLLWVGRLVGMNIGGLKPGEVADWLCREVAEYAEVGTG